MFAFLNKPYPHTDNFKKNLLVSLCIGAFVALFLIVFQPFRISEWLDPDKRIKLAGYGLVSFLMPVLTYQVIRILPVREREDKWTVWKEIVATIAMVLLIAAGNLVYSSLIGLGHISLRGYFNFIFITFSVGIFPIFFSVVSKYNRFLKLNQQTATEINTLLDEKPVPPAAIIEKTNTKLVLIAENEKDKLELESNDLLYIESADNYSMVHYLANGSLTKALVRGSLKRMETQCAPFPEIMRCHRAFIVNTLYVNHIEGNAAGYKLTIKGVDTTVPVSRNYGASVTEKLKTKSV